jgi:hypothetical protein
LFRRDAEMGEVRRTDGYDGLVSPVDIEATLWAARATIDDAFDAE